MASATGTSVSLQSNAYQGRYMKLSCTSSQDISNNKTNISWTLESIGGSSGHYATICRVYFSWYVNGAKTETCVYSIDKGYSYNAFPVTKGSTTGSISVPMDSDGNKTIYVDMDVAIYTSSTTRYSVLDGWKLNTVPRYPSISSFAVNKISGSSTSVSVAWAGSAPGGNISKVEYSTNNGSSFVNANTTSSPFTISGLASNTGYNFKIRVTSSASGLTATSGTVWQSTYQQPTANISTANISGYNGLSQIKVNWSSNMTISVVEFSKDNGASYPIVQYPNSTSGNYTYTGLNEGGSYNFKVRLTATNGSCVTTSGTSTRSTYKRVSGNLYVNNVKVATNNGQTGVALKNGDTLEIKDISNGANCGYKLFFENPDNQHQYLSAKTTGTTVISMTAAQINERLQYFKNDPSQGFNVGLATLNGSDQPTLYYEFFGTISAVNVNPTFDENRWTYQDTNATTVALTGSNQILVNGFSKLRVSVNTAASGNGYAEIRQYIVSGCTSGSSTTTGNIDCANATNGGTITVTAKDSRSNSTPTTKTATFKDYFVPTLESISATRNNGGVGTVTTLTFNGTWWNANFGASNNTLTAVYRYKSGSTWSEARAITLTIDQQDPSKYSFSDTIYGDLAAAGFTLGTTFTIEVTITDELNGGRSWQTTLNSGTPAIAISENNIAIGNQYDTDMGGKLQVKGDTRAWFYNPVFYRLDLTSLSSSNFYPVTFPRPEIDLPLDCEIHSPNLGGSQPYNQNVIHFRSVAGGWADTPSLFNVYEYGCFDSNEIAIGCVAQNEQRNPGTYKETECVWLRGGLEYRFVSNFKPVLHTESYTVEGSDVVYSVGTNYYGGTNTYATIVFTPNSTLTQYGEYFKNNMNVGGSLTVNGTIGRSFNSSTSATMSETDILAVGGGTDGFRMTYEMPSGDFGVTRLKTIDDNNAILELGNDVGGTYKRACYVQNGTLYGNLSGTATSADTAGANLDNQSFRSAYPRAGTFGATSFEGVSSGGKFFRSGLYTENIYNTWWNIINVRHRNGESDGPSYGMQLACGLFDNSLIIRNQHGSSGWTGWENLYRAKSLYNNASGTTGSITLAESAANFSFIEILYYDTNVDQLSQSCKVIIKKGRWYGLQVLGTGNTTSVELTRINTKTIGIDGTSLWVKAHEVNYTDGQKYNANEIAIYAVIGYR